MTLPSSGELSFSMIQAEYGGSHPIKLTEYYGKSSGLPASGKIAVNDFYGETYAPDSDAVTVDPASNTSTNATRYGYGRNGHTGFIHPESGLEGMPTDSTNPHHGYFLVPLSQLLFTCTTS